MAGTLCDEAWRDFGAMIMDLKCWKTRAEPVVSVWRVKGVPLAWNYDDLLTVLKEAGWSKLEVCSLAQQENQALASQSATSQRLSSCGRAEIHPPSSSMACEGVGCFSKR